jgi:hypothetical protein
MTKKKEPHGGFPTVIYVRREEDGELRYFTADKEPAELLHGAGDRAVLARYTYCDRVNAKLTVKMDKDDI